MTWYETGVERVTAWAHEAVRTNVDRTQSYATVAVAFAIVHGAEVIAAAIKRLAEKREEG